MTTRSKTGLAATVACVAIALGAGPGAAQRPPHPFDSPLPVSPRGPIDELVFSRLRTLGIEPAALAADAVFLRRAHLDVIGTLPTIQEVRAFLTDPDPSKRARLVDRLLDRPEYADYWAMKWSDVLRVKSEFPINLWPNAVQAYHRWIRTSLRDNLPFDRFARELLTESGSSFRVPQVNFYRAVESREPEALARAVALTFMGARAEKWPAGRLTRMAAFFSQVGYKPTSEWKEEIVFFDRDKVAAGAAAGAERRAVFPDGTAVVLPADRDPRDVFADWLTAPDNPWFARSVVNRVWFWLFGRGIVHEPDDIRADNPPVSPELLAFLEREFVRSGFDLRHLCRLILTSTTYQLSPVAPSDHPDAEANFAYYALRPLDAEVLIDAINLITGTVEPYSSAIPEPFTFTPLDQRAIVLADASITSTFLETFGRPSRDTGLAAERSNRPTPAGRMYLLNSGQIQRKLEQGPRLQALLQSSGDVRQVVTLLYLTVLSRPPVESELQAIAAYAQQAGANRRAVLLDLTWALVNSVEFLYRH